MNNNIEFRNRRFDFNEFPSAYMCDNKKSTQLRNELIKNQVRISECEQQELENSFFSDENIYLINKQLIYSVYKKTKGLIKIPEQSRDNLIIVMRYVFLEYSRHLPYNINDQIRELNCIVVGEILSSVISNANQEIDYLKELDRPFGLVPLPINVNKNNKNLPSLTSNYF